jgi:hypothetical protein
MQPENQGSLGSNEFEVGLASDSFGLLVIDKVLRLPPNRARLRFFHHWILLENKLGTKSVGLLHSPGG